MVKKVKPPIYVGSKWADKADGSEILVLEVTPYDVRYVFIGVEDIIVAGTRTTFLEDFILRSTPPNTTGRKNDAR